MKGKITNKDAFLFVLAIIGLFFYFATIAQTGILGLLGTVVFVWSGYTIIMFYQKYRKWLD